MKKLTWGVGIVIVIGILWMLAANSAPSVALSGEGVVHKSATCGCCGIWTDYMEDTGLDLQVINREDTTAVKEGLGIPKALYSCHTMQMEGYFIEGHIPAEAVEKLLTERPDIAGIAMPGMPSGSPGMPGAKSGPFVIYAVNHDGTYEEFMHI